MKRELKDLQKIVEYCDRIAFYLQECENNEDLFLENRTSQEGCAFCLIQIGEAVARIPDDVRELSQDTEWNKIKGLRNIVVHRYGSVWLPALWQTVVDRIPVLRDTCLYIIGIIGKED